LTGLR